MPRRLVVLLLVLVALLALECATPTALTVTVYSEVPCSSGSAVALVGGTSLGELAQKAPSSTSTKCGADGIMGNVVVVPAGAKNETIAFAVMQRADGQPADVCLDPAQASGCIVAKRELHFKSREEIDMRVDLRLSCLGVLCAAEGTCVRGTCVSAAAVCGATCDEGTLIPGVALPDAGAPDVGAPDAGKMDTADASTPAELLALTISAGTLSPAFTKATLGYTVTPSIVSLGVPFTVTPTYTTGASVTVNGTKVASGAASPVIALGLLKPTAVDVTLTPAKGAPTHYAIVVPPVEEAYAKASNTQVSVEFGYALAISGDTLAVGAVGEESDATGINGDQSSTSASLSGAVYVFVRSGSTWTQQAYVKASNTRANANFGISVALSGDTLAVGSHLETSNATGIDGNQADTSLSGAGAVYVFTRTGTTWSQEAYVKASNTASFASFGYSVALSGDTLAVGAFKEASSATGINSAPTNSSAAEAGAAYVFRRSGTTWSQEAYVKPSNTRAGAEFGISVALSNDTLAVGSLAESSNATPAINGNQADTSASSSGAAYVFARSGTTWTQQAYVKASNTRANAQFGNSVALSGDTLAVGSYHESSSDTGVNGHQTDTSADGAGAAYVFTRSGTTWAQQAYLKASNTRANAFFGYSMAIFGDTLAISAVRESSGATGVNGDQSDTSADLAGASYVFARSGPTWSQTSYVKASNTTANTEFGISVALSADTLAVGALLERSSATGINGDQSDVSAIGSGAVYILR